ncbi:MAG: tetratricopeptide repeat protein, partial [Candidatus Eisenbacteria bacterium]|nr:tetratricopeptide repeat protein [Candidatus Eisenbacteria bacterium]
LYPNHLAIARDQTLGQYHHRLGVMAEREGHDARARAAYAEALRLDPRYAGAAINLGILTARGGDLDRAETLLQRGVELDPASPHAYLALGQIRQVRGETAAACSLYARAWSVDETFLTGLESYATCRYLLGDLEQAAELCGRLVSLAGESPLATRCRFILDRLGGRERLDMRLWTSSERAAADLAFAARNLESAAGLYRQAIERDPEDLAARLELVFLAAARGDSAAVAERSAEFLRRGGAAEALAPVGIRRR